MHKHREPAGDPLLVANEIHGQAGKGKRNPLVIDPGFSHYSGHTGPHEEYDAKQNDPPEQRNEPWLPGNISYTGRKPFVKPNESIPVIMHSPVELDQLTKLRLKRVRFEGFAQFPIAASELNELIATALKRNEVSTKKWVPPAV